MANLQRNIEVYKAKDCAYLSIHDTSYYPIAPTEANIQIYMPGYDTGYEFAFVLNEINVFNSYSFGLTTSATLDFVELPDGIYTINITTCPDTGVCTRHHLRTCKIDCRLALQWAKYADACEDEKILYYLDRVDFLLRGAEANADLCNPDKATELYLKANDLLGRLELEC
jgi:hypothetical protein